MKLFILLFCFLFYGNIFAENPASIVSLEKKIQKGDKLGNYEYCISEVTHFLSLDKLSPNEKYKAYILKAGIYKKLYKYEHALYFLKLALEEGLKGNDPFAAEQQIKAERSFIFFDKQQFEEAIKLSNQLEKTGYKSLSNKYILYLYTQKGFFLLRDKKYQKAEQVLNEALVMAKEHFPSELPIVYGKQIELYHAINDSIKRDAAYNSGVVSAKKTHNIRYEFYLNEIMKDMFSRNKNFQKAFYHQKKCDSLFMIYNSDIHSSRIELLEQQLRKQEYEIELQNKKQYLLLVILFALILVFLLSLVYKMYRNTKKKNLLIEKENNRIHDEIKHYVNMLEVAGASKNKLDDYPFTERQLKIIELVRKGMSNKEIAKELFITDHTVKYHLKTIYSMLNIKQRNELIILCSK